MKLPIKTCILSILALLLIMSCTHEKAVKKSYSYPGHLNSTPDSLKVNIRFDDLANFDQLIAKIDSIVCLRGEKRPVVIIENDDIIYALEPINFCPISSVIGCYKERYQISIKPDSIFVNGNEIFPIDSLPAILEKHILNENKEHQFSDTPHKAFISFSADSIADIKLIENTLLQTFEHFNSINAMKGDSLPLYIRFEKELWIDFVRRLGPPPPPPPQLPIEEVEFVD